MTCADYAGDAGKFCRDKHTGDDPAFIGKDACEACPECSSSAMCMDGKVAVLSVTYPCWVSKELAIRFFTTVFMGPSGTCEDYGANTKYCSDVYTGLFPGSSFSGTTACTSCLQCSEELTCKQVQDLLRLALFF